MSVTAPSGSARRERGQVLVLFSLFLVVLMATTALAVDYGTWLKARRDYQNAVDPAALAGSALLTRPDSATKRTGARNAAWTSLNSSLGLGLTGGQIISYSNADTGVAGQVVGAYTIWVATPPVNAGTAYPGGVLGSTVRAVFVRVTRDNQAFFSRVIGITSRTVDAWATAGTFPGKFAVITLRQNGQAPNSVGADITLNGNGTTLEVVNGDVGGNWNMKLNSGSQLWLRGFTDDDADAYLIDNISCGNSCWSAGQVNSGPNGTPPNVTKAVLPLPGVIPDPNYALPAAIASAPGGPLGLGSALPTGDPYPGGCCAKSSPGNVDIGGGSDNAPGGTTTVGGVLTCKPGSPKIGPGYYTNITVESGNCLILDPTMRHTSVVTTPADVATPVLSPQLPGVFYVDGSINVNNSAMIVGDGVTIVQRPTNSGNSMTVSSGGVVDLNRGQTPGGTAQKLGAFLKDGSSTYTCGLTGCTYNTSLESNPNNVGIAIYVIKRSQYSSVAADDNSNVIDITSGSGLAWDGITYAPHDNVVLSGQPGHDGVGQLVSWTFTFSGGVNVKQTYAGPDSTLPYLIEPHLSQ
jgi:Flp pilus assembly protein TadG